MLNIVGVEGREEMLEVSFLCGDPGGRIWSWGDNLFGRGDKEVDGDIEELMEEVREDSKGFIGGMVRGGKLMDETGGKISVRGDLIMEFESCGRGGRMGGARLLSGRGLLSSSPDCRGSSVRPPSVGRLEEGHLISCRKN